MAAVRYLAALVLILGLGLSAVGQSEEGDGKVRYGFEKSGPTAGKQLQVSSPAAQCIDGMAGVYPCQDMDLIAHLTQAEVGGGDPGIRMNDLWGWTDPVTGTEWGLVGRFNGLSFVDLSDPSNPVYAGQLPLPDSATINSWRDVKVYEDVAFIVADKAGWHGIQVFDLTRLRGIVSPPETFQPDLIYPDIYSAHNIVINEETGYAYSVGNGSGGTICGRGLHMIDIRVPLSPTFAGCFFDPETGRQAAFGYTHDAQCVIYDGPDTDYTGQEICFGLNETALSIADVTDKANPIAVSVGRYPSSGYIHQGWLSKDHRFLYVNDELDERRDSVLVTRTIIFDVIDLDDPVVIREYLHDSNSVDHNLYTYEPDLMVQGNYLNGVRLFDITDPISPRPFGFFDTTPNTSGDTFGGVWVAYPFFESGIIIANSLDEGFYVLQSTAEKISASIKVAIDGPHDGSGMTAQLSDIPFSQPFESEPFMYYGTQSVGPTFFDDNPDVVDWVMVTIRSTPDGPDVDRAVGFVKEDGTVVGVDGVSELQFAAQPGTYHVVVRHRNHLAVISPGTVVLD